MLVNVFARSSNIRRMLAEKKKKKKEIGEYFIFTPNSNVRYLGSSGNNLECLEVHAQNEN